MTIVIAKITDRHAGKVMLLADTKLTDGNEDGRRLSTLPIACAFVCQRDGSPEGVGHGQPC